MLEPQRASQKVSSRLIERAREMTGREFEARYPHPFLVVGAAFASEEFLPFDTAEISTATLNTTLRSLEVAAAADTARRSESESVSGIYPVVKSEHNPYSGRISVGRARTCDIVLAAGHVSKLHAHLLPLANGRWELRDADSMNGTWRNEEQLTSGERVPIYPGDMLRFGFVEAHFLAARGLHTRLRRL